MVNLKIKLPEGFLDEEERCGYIVSSKMKEVWAVELDLLSEFQRVAIKHNIKYIANGGTMLGAVRHGGFIPWDDDVDIMMLREEYDKLIKIAQSEFRYPYFFQTEYSDPGSLRCHAQLRNSQTTAILKDEQLGKMKFNQGIFIDIFPLDAVPDSLNDWEKECNIAQTIYERMLLFASVSSHFIDDKTLPHYRIKKVLNIVASPVFSHLAHYYYKKYERECRRFNFDRTEKLSLYCWGYKYKKLHRSRVDHEETVMKDFEFMQVPVCKNYDHALTEVFGDWHKFVIGNSVHRGIFFDTEHSYKDFLK